MQEKITISKNELEEIYHLIEKVHYITHRAFSREDADNAAYALAITFAQQNVENELNEIRSKFWNYFSDEELEIINDDIEYEIPYEKSLEELREKLQPFLPKIIKKAMDN